MIDASSLVALALSLAAVVATIGIGALLLGNMVKDTSDLASGLPTRLIKEDTSEAREANRQKALWDLLRLLIVRAAPGAMLVICGAGLLIWIICKLLGRAFCV
jgi:hypothetical protein